ncbi:Nucleoside-diphosphate-sugar epimerase [Halorubrum aquaticum]|uniref:Nucleoside-diphosphate-sugar epimerase n=1 Tax=Halorubrum aquaticum TaxID=387340 RepID=A0A1I3C505_9EURY|nr:NAD(P)-dependent oxidoreductase [Halorubrum aquaticum]SFH69061.1 Nucleoside-diphosphate-sugar epimerase [Halorubrum aquaticum]
MSDGSPATDDRPGSDAPLDAATVLLTGAHGTVGTAVTANSAVEYVLLDREEPSAELGDGTPHPHRDRETVVRDVGDPDAPASLAAVMDDREVDAVVHLAGAPAVSTPYESVERNNVRGTRNVLEAASRAGVDTVVFASSNHAVGMYEEQHAPSLYDPDYDLTVDAESPLRPDSDYGASKVAGEAWCRLYAEREGIDCYALRIGSVRDPTHDHPFGDAERAVARGDCERGDETYGEAVARMRCTWLSRRDCAGLVDACLRDGLDSDADEGDGGGTDDLNPNTLAGGAFEIFYGISDNPNSWFDLEHARERVGYEPMDSGNEMSEPPE